MAWIKLSSDFRGLNTEDPFWTRTWTLDRPYCNHYKQKQRKKIHVFLLVILAFENANFGPLLVLTFWILMRAWQPKFLVLLLVASRLLWRSDGASWATRASWPTWAPISCCRLVTAVFNVLEETKTFLWNWDPFSYFSLFGCPQPLDGCGLHIDRWIPQPSNGCRQPKRIPYSKYERWSFFLFSVCALCNNNKSYFSWFVTSCSTNTLL